jgi:alkanesulfonate monooxygenase SsuD/methylene tetrahydromethanopterin reductase-like flavin-dependent oxidoreductase (luciferase family)
LFWQTPGSEESSVACRHHPFHLATQSATCDILTNGRLDLCLGGRWGARTGEFFGHGENISNAASRARVAEAMALIKLAFASQRANHLGARRDCLGPDHLTSVTA